MKKAVILTYDGSFEGFLTCVFSVFEQKLRVSSISNKNEVQQDFFSIPEVIITDTEKAERVKKGMREKISPQARKQLYYAFLSEMPGIEMTMLNYIQLAFRNPNFGSTDFGNPTILKISKVSKMVSREKHRMEAFVRFMQTMDNIYFAHIEPDFNVLPLILPHFESRYADQEWIIYDLKRKYGLHYNLKQTSLVTLVLSEEIFKDPSISSVYSTSEKDFQELWQQYFQSTNIKSRKNMKLHLQHVPKRYWKFLTEKSALVN